MWSKCDQKFIEFWRMILALLPVLGVALALIMILLGVSRIGFLIWNDIFSIEPHYADWECLLGLASIGIGVVLGLCSRTRK